MINTKAFRQEILKELNTFRENPFSIKGRLESMSLSLSRFKTKANEALKKEVDNYIYFLNSAIAVKPLILDPKLEQAAENELQLTEDEDLIVEIDQKEFEKRMQNFARGYNKISYVADEGADDAEGVINRILFSKKDTKKNGRKILLDESMSYVGIAQRRIGDENRVVLVFADTLEKKKTEFKKRKTIVGGYLDELKEAFDLFDVNKIEKIDIRETLNAMKTLHFDKKNPRLYEIMSGLDKLGKKNPLVDFDTFVTHIVGQIEDVTTDDGLRRIFELFVDDPNSDTITLPTLKKICKELGDETKVEELKRMLESASYNGTELTFDEFADFMRNKYQKSD